MKRKLFLLLPILVISLTQIITAQTVTKFRFEEKERNGNILYATIDGKEEKISEATFEAWITNDGKEIVYSGAEDDNGEAISLRIYDIKTRQTLKAIFVGAAYFFTALKEIKLSNGKRLLILTTGDEVAGATHIWIVDPNRGAIFYRDSAILTKLKGDVITLAFFRDRNWQTINEEDDPESQNSVFTKTKVKPFKTQIVDLKKILKNKVIDTKKEIIK